MEKKRIYDKLEWIKSSIISLEESEIPGRK